MHELPKVHFSLELYQSLIDCKLHVRLKHLLKRLRYYKVQEWLKLVQLYLSLLYTRNQLSQFWVPGVVCKVLQNLEESIPRHYAREKW